MSTEVKPKVPGFVELTTTPNQWWKLSLDLRRRWWTETKYGTVEPSEDLKAAVKAALSVAAGAKVL